MEGRASALRMTARVALVDRATAEVASALTAARVRGVLLKGPALTAWLYDDGTPRPYGDSDLLVAPHDRGRAEAVIASLGYERVLGDGDLPVAGGRAHADTWHRAATHSYVDLHRTLSGARAPAERAWPLLSEGTARLSVAGVEVEVLGLPARTVHVVLHAAAHGATEGKAAEDLRRALARVDDTTWERAAVLASELDAIEPFAAALRLTTEGRAVAARLRLEGVRSAEAEISAATAPPLAVSLEWLARAGGARARVRLLRRLLLPSPGWVRASYPFAHRGRTALAAAYVVRLARIPRYGPRALLVWRRARRATRSRGR